MTLQVIGMKELLKNLGEAKKGWGEAKSWAVGARAEYAGYLERGTSKMAARPFLRPSIEWGLARLGELAREARQSARPLQHIVKSLAFTIEARMKAIMPGKRSGRIYRYGRGEHQASAPGEPPAIDTGNLLNSIFAEEL
jgi:hypothetical protein